MADIDGLLNRWQAAGVLDAEIAGRIRAYEFAQQKTTGLKWQGLVALILGAILLCCGVVLFVSAHWDQLGPGWRFSMVMAMVAIFHLGGALVRERFHGFSTALHAVGTVSTGAAIALVGQIFNIQEHWPAAVLMWALAALAGWILLRDEAQQTLALLLVPAWMMSEFAFQAERHIGEHAYIGRFLIVWAVFYLTFFLGSKRKVVQWILFAASAIAAVASAEMMLEGWQSWSSTETSLPFSLRFWFWVAIAAVPLVIAAFHGHKGLIPISAAIVYCIALPWCNRTWVATYNIYNGAQGSYTRTEPNLGAHALVAAFAVFIIWWGVRMVSRPLVNLGIVFFAIAIAWFYWSDVLDKVGRSLGLIGLGILFLAGGWALEKMRRKLLAQMTPPRVTATATTENLEAK
jgi:uncharacterized membrane protein